MSCKSTLGTEYRVTNPEMTCLPVQLKIRDPFVVGEEFTLPHAWYDQYIARILDSLPDGCPTQQHYDLAAYWLSRAALQRLVDSLYEGEITLEGFTWCRDQIRTWERDHRTVEQDRGCLSTVPATGLDARAWAKAVVRLALAG